MKYSQIITKSRRKTVRNLDEECNDDGKVRKKNEKSLENVG